MVKSTNPLYLCAVILTDTHTHMYLEQFDDDRHEVIDRAITQGVERIFLPNIDSTSLHSMNELVAAYPKNCFPMMGLHPCSVNESVEKELELVRTELKTGKYCAVGEIGIDLHWDDTFIEDQKSAFAMQIEWAKEFQLPIAIHVRESFEEVLRIVDELNDDRLTGVFHCFTGTIEQARHIMDYGGFYLGIGGVVTFKNSGLDAVVKDIPLDRIVLETDAPYLTPAPYRGKRNETGYVRFVADRLAEIYDLATHEVARITTENSKTLFGK